MTEQNTQVRDLIASLHDEQGPANHAENNYEAGWHAALDALSDRMTAARYTIVTTDDEVVARKRREARGAEAIHDLLVMLGVDPDERDEFHETTAETLARVAIRAAGGS